MLTFRAMPPHWLRRSSVEAPETFLDVYYRSLWQHWRDEHRILACGLMAASLPLRLGRCWEDKVRYNHPGDLNAAMRERLAPGADPRHFLWPPARKGIHRLLNPGAFPFSANPLKNKLLFARRCAENGLSVPETLPIEASVDAIEAFLAVNRHLIIKPNFSSRGRGIEGWSRIDWAWTGPNGRRLAPAAMTGHVSKLLASGWVVQQRIAAHPALVPLSPGVLPSLRIITCRDECGAPEVTDVVLRLAGCGTRPVDNFMAGGIAAALDPQGIVEAALFRAQDGLRRADLHPTTGARIAGIAVPDFHAALALVMDAHERIGDGFTVIGWDVGLSDAGPVLIEGNWNPGGEMLQLPRGEGLATRRLGALFKYHLERLPAERWRAAHPIEREPRHAPPRSSSSFSFARVGRISTIVSPATSELASGSQNP